MYCQYRIVWLVLCIRPAKLLNISTDGWHVQRDEAYISRFKQGLEKPFIFHANWNANGKEKVAQMRDLNLWFVKDSCLQQVLETGKQQPEVSSSSLTLSNCCLR